ncbi:MAG: hypothetical protein V1855_03970 [bacterium]
MKQYIKSLLVITVFFVAVAQAEQAPMYNCEKPVVSVTEKTENKEVKHIETEKAQGASSETKKTTKKKKTAKKKSAKKQINPVTQKQEVTQEIKQEAGLSMQGNVTIEAPQTAPEQHVVQEPTQEELEQFQKELEAVFANLQKEMEAEEAKTAQAEKTA